MLLHSTSSFRCVLSGRDIHTSTPYIGGHGEAYETHGLNTQLYLTVYIQAKPIQRKEATTPYIYVSLTITTPFGGTTYISVHGTKIRAGFSRKKGDRYFSRRVVKAEHIPQKNANPGRKPFRSRGWKGSRVVGSRGKYRYPKITHTSGLVSLPSQSRCPHRELFVGCAQRALVVSGFGRNKENRNV